MRQALIVSGQLYSDIGCEALPFIPAG